MMNRIITIVAAGISALIGSGAYLLHQESDAIPGGNSDVAAALSEPAPNARESHRQRNLDDLLVTVSRLSEKVDALEHKLDGVSHEHTQDPLNAVVDQPADSNAPVEAAATLADSEDAAAAEDAAYQAELRFDYLIDQVGYEAHDPAWARTMEDGLHALRERLSGFDVAGTSVVHQDCRSTLCVVEFSHDSEGERDLLSKLIAVPGASEVTFRYPSDDPLKTIAVFAREGHRLPPPPPDAG